MQRRHFLAAAAAAACQFNSRTNSVAAQRDGGSDSGEETDKSSDTAPENDAVVGADREPAQGIPVGLDGHSLRGMRWKAAQLIDFAAAQKLDAVLMNGLHYLESLERNHLQSLRETADRHQMSLYLGAGAIAKNGRQFKPTWGSAESMLATAIDAAKILGSPVVNVRIGSIDDRFLEGGIEPRADEAIRVLKASSSRAKDAGIRFGFENHAADLRSEELVALVEEVGTDVCGVMLDPGNALWAMEDPMKHGKTLAPYTVCNSIRDYTIWPSEDGAMFQWMAIGEGMMDVQSYVNVLAAANPGMPIFVESISNSARPIPFLTKEHWQAYPNLNGSGIIDFLALIRQGQSATIDRPSDGEDRKSFDRQHQKREFLNSVRYLREHCGAGMKETS